MLNFFDYFEYKNAPSFPCPNVDYTIYKGLSTSDIRTFVKYKPYDKWYRLNGISLINFKITFEEDCYDEISILQFVNLCKVLNTLEEIE